MSTDGSALMGPPDEAARKTTGARAEGDARTAAEPDPVVRSVSWEVASVDGHRVRYGVVGSGPAALFCHGWGLRPNAYARPIAAMSAAGCRVVAPSLPGFGGTPELPAAERTFAGYGAWVARFLDAIGVGDLALVAGHSMGGGVSTAFVHRQPERVASLLLANAIGGPTWALFPNEVRTMVQRPFWDWGRHFGSDLLHSPRTLRLLPVLLEDFIPNLMGNPLGMFRTGEFIRKADLVAEVRDIAARGIPVSVAWSDRDGLVPRSAFDDLRRAAGVDGVVVEGSHAWLIADPVAFGELAISALVDARPGAGPGVTAEAPVPLA
ncbi:MAG TPA: alpha/beta fold hydrolase [Acidimicrobiales bacterium]